MSGFFIMHRGWMDSFKPEPFTEREAFAWSIEQAAFDDHDQWFNGQRIPVVRGEFVTSIRHMAKAFQWSEKRIRGFMERMGKCEKWTQRPAHQGAQSPTIITVCNYVKYQDLAADEGAAGGTAKGALGAQQGHSKGTQQNKGNKGNNRKEREDSRQIGDEQKSQKALPAVEDVGIAFAEWQALRAALWPGCRPVALTGPRRSKIATRLGEVGPDGWRTLLANIRASPFLRGEVKDFRVEIDWLLEPRNFTKVMEGNYDERSGGAGGRASGHSRVGSGAIDALAFARNVGRFE